MSYLLRPHIFGDLCNIDCNSAPQQLFDFRPKVRMIEDDILVGVCDGVFDLLEWVAKTYWNWIRSCQLYQTAGLMRLPYLQSL